MTDATTNNNDVQQLTDAAQQQLRLIEADNLRALALRAAEMADRDAAVVRLRMAVRAGDVDAMRAACAGKGGVLLGLAAGHGYIEHVVLEETLSSSEAVPLEDVLGVFFRELGGRFMVDAQYNVCVFSKLILLDTDHHRQTRTEEEAVHGRWAARMGEVVRFLVEELHFPIRMRFEYCARPLTAVAPLMTLAWDAHAWACYFAFARFVPAPRSEADCLAVIVGNGIDDAYVRYWAGRLGDDNDEAVWRIAQHTTSENGQALIRFLIPRCRERRERKQQMLVAGNYASAAAREVMGHTNLAPMIHGMAFAEARF
jgi:hypothetical protein